MSAPWPSWYRPLRTATVSEIMSLAAQLSGLRVQDIRGSGRTTKFALVRHAISLVAKEHSHGVTHIARCMGGRDHSCAVNGVKSARAWIDHDPIYAAFVERLRTLATFRTPVFRNPDTMLVTREVFAAHEPAIPIATHDHDGFDEVAALSRAVAAHYATA